MSQEVSLEILTKIFILTKLICIFSTRRLFYSTWSQLLHKIKNVQMCFKKRSLQKFLSSVKQMTLKTTSSFPVTDPSSINIRLSSTKGHAQYTSPLFVKHPGQCIKNKQNRKKKSENREC